MDEESGANGAIAVFKQLERPRDPGWSTTPFSIERDFATVPSLAS
jgi:hypothetical protein